jgi:hypothetical protein
MKTVKRYQGENDGVIYDVFSEEGEICEIVVSSENAVDVLTLDFADLNAAIEKAVVAYI